MCNIIIAFYYNLSSLIYHASDTATLMFCYESNMNYPVCSVKLHAGIVEELELYDQCLCHMGIQCQVVYKLMSKIAV